MKKTISISIGGRLFYVEDDACVKLEGYLNAVKLRFAALPESEEVMRDFENRAAEHLTSEDINQSKIITLPQVEKLIEIMGSPEEFEGELGEETIKTEESIQAPTGKRRLFRNMDDAMVAGICSGLGAYLGVDPMWVRLFFLVATVFGGSTIWVYIIMWLIVPVAVSTSEKLQMRGDAVTVKSLEKAVEDEAREQDGENGKKRIASLPGRFIRKVLEIIGRLISVIIPIVASIIGAFISIGTAFATLFLIFISAQAIFNGNAKYIEFPLAKVLDSGEYYLVIFTVFFLILVPLIFLQLLGITLMRRKNTFRTVPVIGMLALWMFTLVAGSVAGVRLAPKVEERISNLPEYQRLEKQVPVANFNKIEINNDVRVRISQGKTQNVKFSGFKKAVEEIEVNVNNGTLVLNRHHEDKTCLFCDNLSATVFIEVPNLEKVVAKDSSWVMTENEIGVSNLELDIKGSGARFEVKADKLKIALSDGSHLDLTGSGKTVEASIDGNSRLEAEDYIAQEMVVMAQDNSRAFLNVVVSLSATAKENSRIIYDGNAKLEKIETGNSRVYKNVRNLDIDGQTPLPPVELQ